MLVTLPFEGETIMPEGAMRTRLPETREAEDCEVMEPELLTNCPTNMTLPWELIVPSLVTEPLPEKE